MGSSSGAPGVSRLAPAAVLLLPLGLLSPSAEGAGLSLPAAVSPTAGLWARRSRPLRGFGIVRGGAKANWGPNHQRQL